MIVRNEEAFLGACLDSVKDFVDEMVVVDTGSTDLTVDIAKAAGARVENLSWPGDFAPARNEAMKFVKGDWILVLDADEKLNHQCIPELNALMSLEDVILINLLRYEHGASMAPYSSVSRLFRSHPKIKWNRPYHSIIDDSVNDLLNFEPKWRVVDCSKPALTHEGYRQEFLDKKHKAERLRNAMEDWLKSHPGDPYACAKLGALEILEGNVNCGLELLNVGLNHLQDTHTNEKYELLFHLGIALTPSEPEAAIRAYSEALTVPIDGRATLGAVLNLASLLMQRGDLKQAIALNKAAADKAPEVPLIWYNLGLMYRRSDDLDLALSAYLKAIELNPNHVESYQNLALTRFLLGNITEARKDFNYTIRLLKKQGRISEVNELKLQLNGMVKLD